MFQPPARLSGSIETPARRIPGGFGRDGRDGPGPFAVPPAPAGAPLAALAGGALARRFYSWRGASGARHVVTVHAIADPVWLEIDAAVVLIVEVDLDGGRVLLAAETDPSPARRRDLRRAALARAARGLRCEAHIHLLAETPSARARVAADLSAARLSGAQPCVGASTARASQLSSGSSTPRSRICSTVART